MYRLRLLFAFFTFLMVLVWLRLFYWQVLQGGKIQVLANAQHVGKFAVDARRGEFYTSDGFPLVLNAEEYRIVADPQEIDQSPDKIGNTLAEIVISDKEAKRVRALQIIREATGATDTAQVHFTDEERKFLIQEESSRLQKLAAQKNLHWVQLYSNVSKEIKSKFESFKYKGLSFEPTFGRMYPEASMSGTLSGILASDVNGDPKGSYGLEGYYNGEISGKDGRIRQEQDARGRALIGGDYKNISARNGSDLKLHIDRTVQYIVQKKLQEGIAKYGAKDGSIVVMDPKTGGILAMASYPVFDPSVREFFPSSWYKNTVVADTYEPGSTFKTLVMAAGLDAGVISYDTVCPVCSEPRKVGPFLIKTWNNQYMNNPTMLDILVHSDNTGMVYIGDKLGKNRLQDYLKNFGFGEKTGIDLEDESAPVLRAAKDLRDIDAATETFGQGIAVTPIQMVRAVSALANGGLMMEPHVVSGILRENETVEVKPKEVRRVISEKASATITDMMVKSAEHGEAKFAILPGYRIAGKTGTAQIAIDGVYDERKTIASFVGFAPADDPKYVMLVRLTEPKSSQWGSETAAPLFFNITKELLSYYGIPPSN